MADRASNTAQRVNGLTCDTGALIALERRDARMARVYARALVDRMPITVPSPVGVEWWRARSRAREMLLRSVTVESPDVAVMKAAGIALAIVGAGPSVVDAIVMASAAQRGDLVYTSDVDDLSRLSHVFRDVRVLSV